MNRLLLICLPIILVHSSFYPEKKLKLKLPREYVYIPAGTLTIPSQSAAGHFVYDTVVTITHGQYYISKYEVSNRNYRDFITDASAGLSLAEIAQILPDTAGWNNVGGGEPLVRQYFRHKAFDDYPVVNVSYEGAVKYCEWLQDKIQANNPDFEIRVKIPSIPEWVYAAQGGRSQSMFPWGNYYLRNNRGDRLCNFNEVNDGRIYRDRSTGKPTVAQLPAGARATFTANVKSFFPNDYGLYNMCGNAAELVSDKAGCMGGSWNDYGGDVRILAKQDYQGASPTVGFRPVVLVEKKN